MITEICTLQKPRESECSRRQDETKAEHGRQNQISLRACRFVGTNTTHAPHLPLLEHSTRLQYHMWDAAQGERGNEQDHHRRPGRTASVRTVIGLAAADMWLRQAECPVEVLTQAGTYRCTARSTDDIRYTVARTQALIASTNSASPADRVSYDHLLVSGRVLRDAVATIGAGPPPMPGRDADRRLRASRSC